MINIEDFKKAEMKIGKIITASKVDDSVKLLKLSVDFKEDTPRQVISGIAAFFPDPGVLVNRHFAFVTNLEPRVLLGLKSEAMILAAHSENDLSLLEVPKEILPGTPIG